MKNASDPVSLRHARHVVDAINDALRIDDGPGARIEFFLRSLRHLIGRPDAFYMCAVYETWEQRRPQGAETWYVGEFPGTEEQFQAWDSPARYDLADGLYDLYWPAIIDRPRQPVTAILPDDFDPEMIKRSRFMHKLYLPSGFVQSVLSIWATSATRSLGVSVSRAKGPAFGASDRTLTSLMMRAMAPLVDNDCFGAHELFDGYGLTQRQREVLRLLLTGRSEKQIADTLHRSIHTIHTHVVQIHELLDVSSRGELMALFVDKTAMRACASVGLRHRA